MGRYQRSAPLPARRPVRGGRSLTYTGSAQRIFMIRRRADGRAMELALTSVAIAAVAVTWAFITLQLVIAWAWGEIFDESGSRDRRISRRSREVHVRRGREGLDRARRELLGDGNDKPAGRLVARTASAVDELGPAVEAVAAAWQRGKHAAAAQAAELAGRSAELVSDTEREQTVAALQRHMVAGRLTVEEFEERVGIAHTARTRGDLDRACAQLPHD